MRVATYNIAAGLLSAEILTWATHTGVDVLLLQEIECEIQNPEQLERLAYAHGYSVVYAPARSSGKARTHGLALLSKFQVRNIQVIELPRFNLRFHSRRRIALMVELQLLDGIVRIYNVHLDSRLNISQRLEQLSGVLNHARNSTAERVIVGGDFNTIPLALWRNILPVKYTNQHEFLHARMGEEGFTSFADESIRSFRIHTLRWRLDGIYVRNFVVQNYGAMRSLSTSDHVPLWIDIA